MKKKILLLLLVMISTFQINAQDFFEMKCIGFSVYNMDSVKVANEYLGKVIKVSNNVKSDYPTQRNQGRYSIGNRNYTERQSQTIFVYQGIDYWIVYDRAIFSEDYSCLEVNICRPLSHSTSVGAERKLITLYYVADLSAENSSNIGLPRCYNVRCTRCNGTGKIKPSKYTQHPDECVGICGLCGGSKYLTKQFKIK